ncbi:energy transducer TonB [Rhodanobacter sp. L36]|uniref:energy transducer TonB n=1 Tax=Rhodanobacter sp. L36 TaxID=1747221 RepID=UPI00131E5923|nr:energy transducer TonB [Rhodanobacter sp. L36]
MSSASLAVATRPHPDAARIAAISAAIAFNLAVVLIVSRPIGAVLFSHETTAAPVTQIRWIEPVKVIPQPPMPVVKPLPRPPAVPHTQPRTMPATPPVVVPTDQGNIAAPLVTAPSIHPATTAPPGPAVNAAPVETTLAYLASPLKFPTQAVRERMHGNVLLRVLVDETGKPIDVVIEQSSGYPVLDRSARAQVLAAWRFQPAVVDGRAVQAWARVPVTFDLRQQ